MKAVTGYALATLGSGFSEYVSAVVDYGSYSNLNYHGEGNNIIASFHFPSRSSNQVSGHNEVVSEAINISQQEFGGWQNTSNLHDEALNTDILVAASSPSPLYFNDEITEKSPAEVVHSFNFDSPFSVILPSSKQVETISNNAGTVGDEDYERRSREKMLLAMSSVNQYEGAPILEIDFSFIGDGLRSFTQQWKEGLSIMRNGIANFFEKVEQRIEEGGGYSTLMLDEYPL